MRFSTHVYKETDVFKCILSVNMNCQVFLDSLLLRQKVRQLLGDHYLL